jgi:hypothetical protein
MTNQRIIDYSITNIPSRLACSGHVPTSSLMAHSHSAADPSETLPNSQAYCRNRDELSLQSISGNIIREIHSLTGWF